MSYTDSGDLGTLTMVSAAPVNPAGSGVFRYVKCRFTLNDTGATDTLAGFYVWHDNEAGVTTPTWVDACGCGLIGGGDGNSPTTEYDVLVPTPLATSGATWWETFEEYSGTPDGDTMTGGGLMWSGSWV